MKKLFFSVLLLHTMAQAQVVIKKDSAIAAMVAAVNADSLRSYVQQMVAFGTRNTLSTQQDPKRGIGAARNWVLDKFNGYKTGAGGRLSAFIDTVTILPDGKRVNKKIVLGNVVATLKGTDPADNRIFLISGHLDNRRSDVMDADKDAPGANDDASGVAALIECARIMSARKFSATVIFVAVSGEEQGLLGAEHMSSRALKEKWNIEGVLNNDIVGSNNSTDTRIINNTQVRVFSESLSVLDNGDRARQIRSLGLENDGKSRQLARYVKEIGERYVDNLQVVMVYRNDRFLRGGDHSPYVLKGFPAVRITEMNENYDHQHQDVRMEQGIQYGDLIGFMDFEYLRKNTAMNLANLANLASAPAMPREVTVDTKNLTNFTDLNWSAPASGKVDGYYVLVRETTSPVWQKKIFTTEKSIHLSYSKDNYFFAVQAVNRAGNESLPVLPLPARN